MRNRLHVIYACSALLAPSWAFAAADNATWIGPSPGTVTTPTTGSWNTNGHWSPSGVPTSDNNTIITFRGSGSTPYTATHNAGALAIGTIVLNSSASVSETINGTEGFTHNTNDAFTIRQDGSGSFTIGNDIYLEGGTFTAAGSGSGYVTLSGVISEKNNGSKWLALKKSASSTFVLTGSNIYSHGTEVNEGKLLVKNTSGSGTGSGSVSVGFLGTLGGTGTVAGAVSFVSGGQATAGDVGSAGALTVTNNFTLVSGSKLQVDIGGNSGTIGTAGTHFDQLLVSGSGSTFTSGGAALKVIALPTVVLNQPYAIVKAINSASISLASFFANLPENTVYTDGNLKYKLNYTGSEIDLTFTAVPEPTAMASLGASAFALLRRRRRR